MAVDLPALGEDPWGAKLNTAILSIDTAKTAILSGTASPGDALGNVGDYYLDTDDRILYGPKVASSFGAPQNLTTDSTASQSSIGTGRTLGARFQVATSGQITAIRFYRPAGATNTSRNLTLWSDAGAVLATLTTTGDTGSGWKSYTLPTPVAVLAGTYYRVSYDVVADYFSFATNGTLVSESAALTNPTAVRASSTANTFPTETVASNYLVDVVFQSGLPPWPVALKSVPPGGTTGQYLKKLSGADYAVGWVT